MHRDRLGAGLVVGKAAQDVEVLGLAQTLGRWIGRRRRRVQPLRIRHRHGARQPAHFGQLVVGEGGVLGPAPADHVDVGERRGRDGRTRFRHDVALDHLVGRFGEHACDIERHVAVADHRHRFHRRQVGALAEIGMAVQPADKAPRAPDMRQLLARHAELPVDHHAGGDDDGVVARDQLVPGQVAADLDIAGEAHIGPGQQAVELARHGLGALVVGRHPGPDQAVRRRQPVDDVDMQVRIGAHQPVGGIKAGRARAHDGDAMSHDGPLSI